MTETFLDGKVTLHIGDVREQLRAMPDDHFDCVVTSPPYWGLRDYGTGSWVGGLPDCDHAPQRGLQGPSGQRADRAFTGSKPQGQVCGRCGAHRVDYQIGLEPTLGEHLAVMVEVFREVRRVLKPTGTLWLNYGDCYATSPNGRPASEIKEIGNDDRTFRDKPFSTVGPILNIDRQNVMQTKHPGGTTPKSRIEAGGYLKPKDLCMIPNRLAIALQDDGWWVRSEIIWHKPNPMPESTRDRPTTAHEKIWLLTKRERYFYDAEAIAEPASPNTHARISQNLANQVGSYRANGGNKTNGPMRAVMKGSTRKIAEEGSGIKNNRSYEAACSLMVETRNSRNVWTMGTAAFSEAHFATFPAELAERCIKAGCPAGGTVLDPFGGAGTTALAALSLGRQAALIELNPDYAVLARARIEAAFMGKEEGQRHMTKMLGKLDVDAGPLFATIPS